MHHGIETVDGCYLIGADCSEILPVIQDHLYGASFVIRESFPGYFDDVRIGVHSIQFFGVLRQNRRVPSLTAGEVQRYAEIEIAHDGPDNIVPLLTDVFFGVRVVR